MFTYFIDAAYLLQVIQAKRHSRIVCACGGPSPPMGCVLFGAWRVS